jgi:hypothetical protein
MSDLHEHVANAFLEWHLRYTGRPWDRSSPFQPEPYTAGWLQGRREQVDIDQEAARAARLN